MSVTEEFLKKVREIDGMKNAILQKIEIFESRKTVRFFLVTDSAYAEEAKNTVAQIAKTYLPQNFTADAQIEKRNPDETLIRQEILRFMKSRFPAASAFLEERYIEVEKRESGALFRFVLASGEQALFTADNVLDEVAKHLSSEFCGSFFGDVRLAQKEREALKKEVVEESDVPKVRVFPIENYKKLDGADPQPKYASYLVDCNAECENVAICGRLISIQERQSKSGRKYYSLEVADPTGRVRGAYFPKKATAEKIAELKADDYIVCVGDFETFNSNLSFNIKKIDYGTPPQDFEMEAVQAKKVPKAYHYVFPEPFEVYMQSGLFEDSSLPEDLKKQTFVVFDLETTGLNNQPAVGKVDRIIEIGAVKIKEGNIVEKFSTFVACSEKLSQKIIDLTGINDADLIGAPECENVIADFYKFVDGCALVGHNVQFDYRFVRYYGEQYRYIIDAKTYDTWTIAQEVLRGELTNFKLNTIADYYGITFNHHRAFDDALTTAKVFIQLVKKRGGLQGI